MIQYHMLYEHYIVTEVNSDIIYLQFILRELQQTRKKGRHV